MIFDTNIKNWEIVETIEQHNIYRVRVGNYVFHTDCDPHYDVLMRKTTHEKIVAGEYLVKEDFNGALMITDSCGFVVPKILPHGVCCEIY